ncbi:sugar ABC transporter ATP-binding protein [Nonomuraea soli]|uniref:ABC-type sugar transport system ATPase subunit n=1 Tax=Nonomuraea soli TaxID=1032476 RepID=A0A7W0CFL5_9ACTN|nr:sugar ABC transporter ATP-binding protein [Nonomuraea soli]MBA2890114.1 ABC-type sugar transport system ATPase subunit [Nonomuraea soli]
MLLRVTGLSKRFGATQALDRVKLILQAGEVLALAGENGSGKSTLSKIIAGAVQPDEGTIELDGKPVNFADPRAALAAGVCIVSQEPTLVPHLSVAENVLLTRLGRLVSRASLARRAEPLLRRVGLDVDPLLPLASLAPGDRELVELAKALGSQPKLLILDEATARMPDPSRLFDVVDQLKADDVGVIFISHRLPEMRRLAKRATVLRDGRNAAELDWLAMTDQGIASAMVGRDFGDFYHKAQVPIGEVRLEVRDLVTRRSPYPVTFTVRAGEIVGIAGLVGAGRSELLEAIGGAHPARSGLVLVDGRRRRVRSPIEAHRAGIVLVPEDRLSQALVPGHSIRSNLAMPWLRALERTDHGQEDRRARRAIAAYGIRCQGPDQPISGLSGGNAQKVVLARAVGQDPGVLLLDEPTRGVDIGARTDIYEIVAGLAARGAALVLVSSDLPELLGLADRIIVLADGRPAGELTREEATEEAVALLALGGGQG